MQALSLTNLVTTSGFTAALDLDSVVGAGDTAVLSTDLVPFTSLAAEASSFFDVFFDLSTVGTFSTIYTLNLSDQDLAGATTQTLTLTLLGEVIEAVAIVPEPASLSLLGTALLCLATYCVRRRSRLYAA